MPGKKITFNPSMFYKHYKSPDWIWRDRMRCNSPIDVNFGVQPLTSFRSQLTKAGQDFEMRQLKLFQKTKHVYMPKSLADTYRLMREGVDLMYQAPLLSETSLVRYSGTVDFLRRHPEEVEHFRPIEVKWTGKIQPCHRRQLMSYGKILGEMQGHMPDSGYFIYGNDKEEECEFSEELKNDTENITIEILDILAGKKPSFKINAESKINPWFHEMLKEAKQQRDIALIHGLREETINHLRDLGITRLEHLCSIDLCNFPKIKGASKKTLKRAKVQAESLITNNIYLDRSLELPANVASNIYFDVETNFYPRAHIRLGLWIVNEHNEYLCFDASGPDDEHAMWKQFLQWLDTIDTEATLVFHYTNYDITALKELKTKYGGSEQLENFMQSMVDLAVILKESFVLPLVFYSLNDVAGLINKKNMTEHQQSFLPYSSWVREKNKEDVQKTRQVHEWLLSKAGRLGRAM